VRGVDIDLSKGLGEIADDAPTAHLSAEALWRDGTRRRNRRRAGAATAVVASVALLAGGVVVAGGVLRTDPPPVADASTQGRLPDRVWMPSPWTQGTARAGDPGRIAVMFWDNGQRRSLGGPEGGGYVTVSAVDGAYRYLDADGLQLDGATPPVLSPDGRYLAYQLASPGAAAPTDPSRGWAVYDAQTGAVRRHVPDDVPLGVGTSSPVWTPDSSTLLMDVCRVTQVDASTQSCTTRRTDVWEVPTDEHWSISGVLAADVVGRSGQDLLVREGQDGPVGRLDVRSGEVEQLGRPGGGTYTEQTLGIDPTGRRATVATVFERLSGWDLEVVREGLGPRDGTEVAVPVVEGARYVEALDVLEDGRVLAAVQTEADGWSIALTDAASPLARRDVVGLGDYGGAQLQVATALAATPTATGVRPPDLRDPRAGIGGIALALGLAGGVALAAWRRRRGPLGAAR
jgi:hypothetical protein